MSMNIGEIRASVKLDYDGKGLSRLDDDMKKAGKSVDQLESKTTRLGGKLKSGLKVGALAAGAAIGTGLVVSLRGAIEEAREAERTTKQTEAVLKSTGNTANTSAKQIEKLAGAISNKVGIDDEAVQSTSNLLLTFKNIQNSADGTTKTFDRATMAVVDMAAGMTRAAPTAESMRTYSIQLGKALNDPIKGMTALGKAGVQFTEDQKAQIETLVENGKMQKAQAMILREVESQFKGSAKGYATGVDRLRVTWDNFLETIGLKLTPLLDKGAKALTRFLIQFQNGKGAGGEFRRTLEDIWKTLENIWPTVKAIGLGIGKLIRAFASLPGPVQATLLSLGGFVAIGTKIFGLVKVFGAVKWAATGLFTVIKMAPLAMGVAGLALMALVTIAVLVIKNWDSVKAALGKTWSWIKNAAGDLAKWVSDKAKKGFLGPLPLIISRWKDILGFIREVPGKVGSFLSGVGRIIVAPFKWAVDRIKETLDRIVGFFRGAIDKVKGVVGGVGNAIGAVGDAVGLAQGGVVGPGAGGPRLFLAGEGRSKEFVISTEGPRSKNVGYLKEAASALGIPGFDQGGKPGERIGRKVANLQQNMALKRREFELSGGKLTSGELDRLIKLNMGIEDAIRELVRVSKGQAKKDARFALRDAQLNRRDLVAEKVALNRGAAEAANEAFSQTPNVDRFIDDLETQLALAEGGYGGDPEKIRAELKKRLEQKLAILRNKLSGTKNRDQIAALNDAIRGTLGELSGLGTGGSSGPSFIEQVSTASQLRYEALAGFGSNAMQMGLGSGGRTLAKAGGTTVVLNGEFKLDGNDPHSSVRKLGYQIANNLA